MMKTNSITFRLIAFITIVFMVTIFAVMGLVDGQFRKIVDKNQREIYGDKLEVIRSLLSRMDSRLQKTGMVEAYQHDFREHAVNDLRKTYYHAENQRIYPFIISHNYEIIMHPNLAPGDRSLAASLIKEKLEGKDSGEFNGNFNGTQTYHMFKRYDDWNWIIVYAVPVDMKYQEIQAFRKVLAGVFLLLVLAAVVVMTWLLSRVTQPIVNLTEATTLIGSGNLDQKIDSQGDDEVGMLARSFNSMREAIKDRIEELNAEIAERRKAEKASAVFQSALAASTDAIGMSTPDGVHYYQNDAFNRMFGDIGDDPPATLYVDSDRGRKVFKTIMAGGRWEGELQMYGADGKVLDILLRAYSLTNQDGQVTNLIGVHTDITESKRAAAALEKRIVALTQPLESDEGIAFDDLFNLADVQKLQDEFAEATGVASLITDTEGNPITKPSNFRRLCDEMIHETEIGKKCFQSATLLAEKSVNDYEIKPSLTGGLWDAGAAIAVGGRHIANWLIGQVRDETISEADIRKYALEHGKDADRYLSSFLEIPAMSKDRFGHVAQALFTLAKQFSTSAYQNVQQARFITERKEAEVELKRNEENLRTTLNSIGDAVISVNRESKITNMNPVAESLTGWGLDDAALQPLNAILNIIRVDTREPIRDPVPNVLNGSEAVLLEDPMLLLSKGGAEFRVAVSVAPICDDSGTTQGGVLVLRDVTAELEMEEQLRHSQKMDAVGQLAGGVAHDFNNMLGGILGGAELLKLKVNDPNCDSIIDMVIESAERAAALTQKLLAFSRKQPTVLKPVNAGKVIDDALSLFQSTADRRITVDHRVAAEGIRVTGDVSMLQNVFLNLFINASHAMQEGGVLSIHTSVEPLDEHYCGKSTFDLTPGLYFLATVRDTGVGIESEVLPRIYEPFFSTKGPGQGTGLGLSAAYGAIVQHKGEIIVESTVGVGTCFKIYLPITESHAVETVSTDVAITGKGRILVVDDEIIMRTTADAILSNLGYDVTLAENGLEALSVLKSGVDGFDLVLLDMIMPKMNGRDCYVEIKQIKPDVPVILASGYTHDKDLKAMNDMGLNGYIRKPFRRIELSQIVHEAIMSNMN